MFSHKKNLIECYENQTWLFIYLKWLYPQFKPVFCCRLTTGFFLFQRSIYIPEFPFYSRVSYPTCSVPFLFHSHFSILKSPFICTVPFLTGFLSIRSSQLLDTYLHFGDMRSLILQGSFYILGLLFCTSSFSIQPFFSIQFLFCSRDPILFQSSVSIPKYPFISRVPFLFHGFFQFQFILLIYLTSSLHLGEYEH